MSAEWKAAIRIKCRSAKQDNKKKTVVPYFCSTKTLFRTHPKKYNLSQHFLLYSKKSFKTMLKTSNYRFKGFQFYVPCSFMN